MAINKDDAPIRLTDEERRKIEERAILKAQLEREAGGDDDNGGRRRSRKSAGGGGIIVYVAMIVLTLLGVFYSSSNSISKDDFVKSMASMDTKVNGVLDTATKQGASMTTAINNLPSTITNQVTTAVNNAMGQVTSRLSAIEGKANTIDSNLVKGLADANTKIDALKTQLTADEARIKAMEDKLAPSTTDGSVTTIPNMTISASVLDEGTIQVSDNSTIGEIKISLVNSGTADIVDISLSTYIYFDNCGYSDQSITSASYGSWSIRNRATDEIEIRGKISRVEAGKSRKIYLDLRSKAYSYQAGNATTLDTSTSDIDIIDWDTE